MVKRVNFNLSHTRLRMVSAFLPFDSVQLDEGVTVNLVVDKPLSIRTTGGDIILSTLLDLSGANGSSGNRIPGYRPCWWWQWISRTTVEL